MFFTCFWLSFAVTLYLTRRRDAAVQTGQLSGLSGPSRFELLLLGVLGGVISSVVESGLDILTFSVLVLFFRVPERIATPTSVILMASNAVVGFGYRGFVQNTLAADAWAYWYVCVPVVVVGAPLGAWFIRERSDHFIRRLLYTIIVTQFAGALLIVPQSPAILFASASTLLSGALFFIVVARLGLRWERRRAPLPLGSALQPSR